MINHLGIENGYFCYLFVVLYLHAEKPSEVEFLNKYV